MDCSNGRGPLIKDTNRITFSAVDGAERPCTIRQFFLHLLIQVMNKICRKAHLTFTASDKY